MSPDYINDPDITLPCGHAGWFWLGWGHNPSAPNGLSLVLSTHSIVMKRCYYCGAVVPLGPSNDALAAVQVEIRAAELAIQAQKPRVHFWRVGEADGFCAARDNSGRAPRNLDMEWHAGWLAHAIASHEEHKP